MEYFVNKPECWICSIFEVHLSSTQIIPEFLVNKPQCQIRFIIEVCLLTSFQVYHLTRSQIFQERHFQIFFFATGYLISRLQTQCAHLTWPIYISHTLTSSRDKQSQKLTFVIKESNLLRPASCAFYQYISNNLEQASSFQSCKGVPIF